MSLLTRALLILAPRRRVRAAFTRHYERGDWHEPETVSGRGSSLRRTAAVRRDLEREPFNLGRPLRLISERESVEDRRYLDKSLGLWALV